MVGVRVVALFIFLLHLDVSAAIDESQLPPTATNRIEYLRDIKPILDDHCLRCHGPSKPKSGFRLDSRALLLKGGENGVAVIPGQSAKSPFIHDVARLVADMEMPPAGKGEALTPEQIGLLRAWIDQDLPWTNIPAASRERISVSPTVRYVSVRGDERRFREHSGIHDGWSGGLEHFDIEQDLDARTTFITEGRALRDDYSVTLSIQREGVGFVRGGFDQARSWQDDTGGYFGAYTPPQSRLRHDLHLDTGRAWIEAGATAPFGTQFKVAYEYRQRDGEIALTRWLPAGPVNDPRRILPNSKEIEERLHILRLDAVHEWETVRVADSFRYEFNDIDTYHRSVEREQATLSTLQQIHEQSRIQNLANAFSFEKYFTSWLLVSGGHLYTHLDGDTDYDRSSILPNGQPATGSFWSGHGITLRREAQVLNLNAQAGPWQGFTLVAGGQVEWNHQETFGPVNLAETDIDNAPALTNNFSFVTGDIDRFISEERAGLRYTKIPYTVLYAEGDWRQESIDEQDALLPGHAGTHEAFSNDADISKDWRRYRAGFDVSPWSRVSLSAWYESFNRRTDFDQHTTDLLNFPPTVFPGGGYPGFLERQDIDTDEAGARLVLRPAAWLKTAISYRVTATDFRNTTKAYPGVTRGGRVYSGNHDAQNFGVNATLTPWRRIYFCGNVSYQDLRTVASDNGNSSITPCHGHVFSSLISASSVLDAKTDATVTYDFSYGDFAQRNSADGLPLGLEYRLHTLRAGVSRQLTKTLRAGLEYFFSLYDEPYSHGLNNYTAHGVFTTLHYRWQ